MPLRDYQQECIDNISKARENGVSKMLCVSPTGSGKAVVLAHVPQALGQKQGEQSLVLVHRKELVTQLAEKLATYNPTLKVGIERAQFRCDPDADLIVASVQTIGKAKTNEDNTEDDFNDRLRQFDPNRLRHLIVDECHHVRPESDYGRVLRYFNVFKPDFRYDDPAKNLLGFTATPQRQDGLGLETILDEIVFSRDLRTLMTTGITIKGKLRTWLCEVKAFRVETDVEISSVSTRQGDFATGELEKAVNTPARNKLIVEKYRELAEGATAFAFTVDIQHSNDLAETFRLAGIQAYAISGNTPDIERRRLMNAFGIGQVKVLCSCGVLSEGIDIPSVGCLLMARPTKSSLLFRQQIGRGLRPSPSPEEYAAGFAGELKKYCVIVDFCDVAGKHAGALNTVPSLFGLRPNFDMQGKKALEVLDEVEKIAAKAPGINLSLYSDLEKLRGAAIEIDLFKRPLIPPEIASNSQLAWTTGMSEGVYQMSFDKSMLTIRKNLLGAYEIFRHVQGVRTPLGSAGDLRRALALAEMEVPSEWYVRLQADAQWRFAAPTDKQLGFYAKLYPEVRRLYASDSDFAEGIKAKYDKGELSMLITQRAGPARAKPVWAGRGR